jgi:predicted MFS family arabinose efflux permease
MREATAMPTRRTALAVAVGLVLADSSVVVLALPEIYRELDVSVTAVAWVLVAFNLTLALVAVPSALASRALGPARLTVAGLVVFAVASLACGLADSIELLLGARCVQAIGGAAAVCAALELMPSVTGSERAAAVAWARAGAIGAAIGPGVGGLLTDLVSWQSIFLVQVPVAIGLAVALAPAARGEGAPGAKSPAAAPPPYTPLPRHGVSWPTTPHELRAAGRPHLAANAALALVSAALAAALFLIVLLLIEGWRMSPIGAAAAISVMPLAALAGGRIGPIADGRARAAAGAILLAGGLAALALLPSATVLATIPPQLLVGAGLALTLSALTEAALAGRSPQAIHGGWTIAARHAGVVAGLLVLTPVFTSDLDTERENAEQAGTAALLDSHLDPSSKIDLAERLADRLREEGERVPVLDPAFEPLPDDPEQRAQTVALQANLQDELDRAATHAFSDSFLIAAAFALAALAPVALARERVEL